MRYIVLLSHYYYLCSDSFCHLLLPFNSFGFDVFSAIFILLFLFCCVFFFGKRTVKCSLYTTIQKQLFLFVIWLNYAGIWIVKCMRKGLRFNTMKLLLNTMYQFSFPYLDQFRRPFRFIRLFFLFIRRYEFGNRAKTLKSHYKLND